MSPVEMWLLSAGGALGYAAVLLTAGCCLIPAAALMCLSVAMAKWPAAPGKKLPGADK